MGTYRHTRLVKTKSVRETCFWPFFGFFSRTKNCFHAHFFHFLHAHFFAFTGTFLKFFELSRALFWFHGHFFENCHGHFENGTGTTKKQKINVPASMKNREISKN